MIKKLIIKILQFQFFAGFFLLVGTAGSSDLDLISFSQIVTQSFIALGFMLVGFVGFKLEEYFYEY